jgi:hypothetical protein
MSSNMGPASGKPILSDLDVRVMDRFWRKVNRNVHDPAFHSHCWEWQAGMDRGGYGRFTVGEAERKAHRVSYTWEHQRDIAAGMTLDHLCRNRACVNPAHLEETETWENTRRGDAFSAVNERKTHCPKGHPLVEGNLRASVSAEGRRGCITCHREDAKRSHAKRQAIINADPKLRAAQLADKKRRNKERRDAVRAAAKHLGMGYKEYITMHGENRERALAFLNTPPQGQHLAGLS